MPGTPPLPRYPSIGYVLTAPLPFIAAPLVLDLRGRDFWLVVLAGLVAGLAGYLIGSLVGLLALEGSTVVREALGTLVIPMAATIVGRSARAPDTVGMAMMIPA